MRFLSKLACAVVVIASAAAVSHAQGPINPILPEQGTKEVALRGNFHFEPSPSSYSINGTYGVFLNTKLEVGGSLGFNHTSGSDFTTYAAFANYHFPGQSQLVPFAGVQIGGASGGGSTFAYGVQGGVKYFVNSSVAATAQLDYLHYDKDIAAGKRNSLDLNFGLAVYLR